MPESVRYQIRSGVKQTNARHVRVRKYAKVFSHLIFRSARADGRPTDSPRHPFLTYAPSLAAVQMRSIFHAKASENPAIGEA